MPNAQPNEPIRTLDESLNYAYDRLFWISEAPNRNPDLDGEALKLAEFARESCAELERHDRARAKAAKATGS